MASTAELEAEILADLEENPDAYTAPVNDVITIDPETKTINLPSSEVLFGTEEEHDVERKYFKCPRIVGDNIDLFTHQIYISYMAVKDNNATFIPNSIPQSYWCDDVALDETGNYITFSWLLSGNVLASRGFVGFAVIAKSVEGDILKTRWKTAPAVGTVLMTLPDAGEGIAELYPDIITQLLDRMDAVEEITSVELDESLSDNTKAAPAGMVGELKVDLSKLSEEKIDNPSTGSVGQILEIESVDEKGKPKTYKAVDKPTSSGEVSDEQISSAVSEYMANNPIEESDPTVPEWAKQPTKPTYTAHEVGALPDTTKIPSKTSDLQNDSGFLTQHQDLSGYALKSEIPNVASDIGAESEGTAESKVSAHNVSDTAHNDIRLLVQGLTERFNALADSDDTTLDQMSEIVSYIKYNRSLINGIDTNKVDVSDIVNNLISNNTDKPLSAKQGRELKALIDAIVVPTKLSELENDSGYAKTTDIPDKLPNPQKLTFAGAVTAEYDGSGAVTVTIPESSGGSGVSDEKIAEAVGTYMESHPIEETDPTVPEWAKQQDKPSYTAEEVEALPNTTTTLPNPYPLTFTGGASGSYDGSKALTINIPSGGDGSTYYVTPEQFGAIGDGVTDDSEAFRQAIETEYPIICMTGKDYYFANEIVTSKTRINIDGNYSHFTAFRLKINLNEDETNWKTSYPHPDSVIQNVYFMNKNNMDYCIKTGIPIKFVNIDVYYYDLWLKNYGDYMDYMVFDNLAINSRPSNEHYCIELSYLGDNHVFRECRFGGYDTNINYVQVSGCKAVNFIDCVINGNVIAYQSVVNLNGCHFENEGQIIIGDTNLNSVINFNSCFFSDQYTVTHGKNVFYNGCEFLVNYRTYGGQNDYMALNTRDCIILCGTESASSDSNVIIDELRKNEYPNVVYSGNKVVFTPVVLKHTAKTWGLSAGTYTYKFFQSCNPYSIDYGDPAYSTVEESVTVDADTSAVRFRSNYDTYPEMFIHAYRTAPDGSIKKVVIPINGQYIYDYGETLNGILWKEVESIPAPKSTTAVYRNGIYYSGKNYTNARNCICVDKANSAIVWIDENGSPTIISGSGSGGLTESQVNNLIDEKLTGVETLLGGGF